MKPLLAAVSALAAAAYIAVPAQAAPPTLLSAGRSGMHLIATWSLPSGAVPGEVEVSSSPRVLADGSFANSRESEPMGNATAWRSDASFPAGTWYVHVSATDVDCSGCPPTEWSNVLAVTIPRPVPLPGRYSGITNFGDGKPISFLLRPGARSITGLTVGYELVCFRGRQGTGTYIGRDRFLRPIPVRADGRFSALAHYPIRVGSRRGTVTISVTGRLRPPSRATGELHPRAALSGGERCRGIPPYPDFSVRRRSAG